MVRINIQNLTYRFDNGDTLFADLSFTLDNQVTGLVGRNGVGKSVLALLLAGERHPSSGLITRFCRVGLLPQIGTGNFFFQDKTISDYLGIRDKLQALSRINEGKFNADDFELVDNDWLLQEHTEQRLQLLGLPPYPFLSCKSLSSGQLTRLALHQLFESDYGYLILDEPGNHLDEHGKNWLIKEISNFSGGILIISHDRSILRCVDDIIELDSLGLHHYGGAYDIYAEQRARQLANQEQRIIHTKSKIRKMYQTIQKNREKAQKRAGQGKQLARSGSQAKILLNNQKQNAECASGNQENSQGRQLARIKSQLSSFSKQYEAAKQYNLHSVEVNKRVTRVLALTKVRLLYSKNGHDITFTVNFGDKIRIAGPNGCGKSTLLKTIAGQLQPAQGTIQAPHHLCYIDQYFTLLNSAKSVQENLADFCTDLTETEQRTLLAGIGLRHEKVNQAIATLSGGEKMKVAILITSHQPDNTLLLLDEPDNHLDLDAKHMLAQFLRNFTGSLLIVSHDNDFIKDIGVSNIIPLDA